MEGYLQEVFVSFQGEGTRVGQRQVFVRTAGCSLRCRYCDTPQALVRTDTVTVHGADAAGGRRELPNPVSVAQAAGFVEELATDVGTWVVFTGGEPLEQPDYLEALAQALYPRPIYLETAGVHAEAMRQLKPHVQCVALDVKLDSVAGEGDRRAEHREFLEACRGVERMVKAVVGATADLDELEDLARLVAEEDRALPFLLQPETPRDAGFPALPAAFLEEAWRRLDAHLDDVRVIPQTHRFLRIP